MTNKLSEAEKRKIKERRDRLRSVAERREVGVGEATPERRVEPRRFTDNGKRPMKKTSPSSKNKPE